MLTKSAGLAHAAPEVSTGAADNPAILIVVLGLAVVVAAAVAIPIVIVMRSRRIVSRTSTALAGLRDLNSQYADSVMPLPVLQRHYRHVAKSKSALERLDLTTFMAGCVLEDEAWLAHEIEARSVRMQHYSAYTRELTTLGEQQIGRTTDSRLAPDRYSTIERRNFHKQILAAPAPLANIVATASYTSPKGQNSYTRRLDWDFAHLEAGMHHARRAREQRSTTEYLRQRERSLMTPKLRTDVLRRDGSRCRMCGASAADGATLHIDHILPVSHGGRTVQDNLQTLCQSCNLGKSNRFVG